MTSHTQVHHKDKRTLATTLLNWFHDGPLSVSTEDVLNSQLDSEQRINLELNRLLLKKLLIVSVGGRLSLTNEGHLASESFRHTVQKPLLPNGQPFSKDFYTTPTNTVPVRRNSEDFLGLHSLLTFDLLY